MSRCYPSPGSDSLLAIGLAIIVCFLVLGDEDLPDNVCQGQPVSTVLDVQRLTYHSDALPPRWVIQAHDGQEYLIFHELLGELQTKPGRQLRDQLQAGHAYHVVLLHTYADAYAIVEVAGEVSNLHQEFHSWPTPAEVLP